MTTSSARIAVVGATGLVGRTIVELLLDHGVDPSRLHLVASRERTLTVRGTILAVHAGDLPDVDLVLSSTPDEVARERVPAWLDRGATVIDESAAWRHDPAAALVTAGVNDHCVTATQRLYAGPNCTTIQIALVLAPLQRAFGLEELVISTYQAASGAGLAGLEELRDGTGPAVFERTLRGDLIPRIGRLDADGVTSEERKLGRELPKLLEAEPVIHATCVRVPVEIGHSASVWMRTREPVRDVLDVLGAGPGLRLDDGAPGPSAVAGTDDVVVARVRVHGPHELSLWCVADNLRVGAATNAVRIAERWIALDRAASAD